MAGRRRKKMSMSDPVVKGALSEMGVTQVVLMRVTSASSKEEGERLLEEAKATCKKGFRERALELHPDVNGGDEAKTLRFKQLKDAYEGFKSARFRVRTRRPARKAGFRVFSQRQSRGPNLNQDIFHWGGSSTTTSSSPSYSSAYRVDPLRPTRKDWSRIEEEFMRMRRKAAAERSDGMSASEFYEFMFGGRMKGVQFVNEDIFKNTMHEVADEDDETGG